MAPSSFFTELDADGRRIRFDCDVMAGHWPARADLDLSPERISQLLERGGIDSALVSSGRAVWFDEAGGNAEADEWASAHGWQACYAVNLRDAWGIGERLDRWAEAGVRSIRLPGVTQGISPGAPGYQLTVQEAAARGFVMLAEGAFSAVQGAFRGLGAKVIFCDASYYETADFLIAAEAEPGFVASTRKLLGPDTLAIVAETVGAHHLAYGSGTPLQDLEPTLWRLRDERLTDDDFAAIAGGTLQAMMELPA